MSHDSLSEDFFEVLWHDEVLDKSSLKHFSKQSSFLGNIDPIWLKITQPTALKSFRNILARCDVIVKHQSYLSIFQKKFFLDQGQLGRKLCNLILMIYSVTNILKWHSMMGYNSQTKVRQNVSHFFQKTLFWQSNSHLVWAKIMQPSVLLFVL